MAERTSSRRTAGLLLCIAAALGLRAYMLLSGSEVIPAYAVYACLCGALGLIAWECSRNREYAPVFVFENRFHLDVFAGVAAVGFFTDFVVYCHVIYQSLLTGGYRLYAVFAAQCLIGISALLACFYCSAMALSFHSGRYDFRTLKLLHAAPLMWAIGHMLTLVAAVGDGALSVNELFRYAAITAALGFFFLLAFELESDRGARRLTVFFARIFSVLATVYFLDTVMLLAARKIERFSEDTALAAVVMMISGFAFFLEKNILAHTTTENHQIV